VPPCVAIWLKALGAVEFPKDYQCQIRIRWEDFFPKEQVAHQKQLLDLDDMSFEDDDRIAQISSLLRNDILLYLERTSSIEGIRAYVKDNAWLVPSLTAAAREVLEHSS